MFNPKNNNGDFNDQLLEIFRPKQEISIEQAFKSISNLDLKLRYLQENIEEQQVMLVKGLKVIRKLEKENIALKKALRKKNGISKRDVAHIMENMLNARASQIAPNLLSFSEITPDPKTKQIEQLIDTKVRTAELDAEIFTTKVKSAHNHTITKPYKVVETSGKGNIEQILLTVQDSNFGLFLMVDGNVVYDKDFTYFSENNDYIQNMSCFLDDDTGKYYLSIRNFFFQENFRFDVNTSSTSTFEEIMVKYTIRDEEPV